MIDLLSYLDVTKLEHDIMERELENFLKQSYSEKYHAAAVCIAQENIRLARQILHNTPVKVASVFNFPLGMQSLIEVEDSISWAINEGVQECDVVLPLKHLVPGQSLAEMRDVVTNFVKAVRNYCPHQVLKIIIATDILKDSDKIKVASEAVIAARGDFIKTCTGKSAQGVTPEAVDAILEVVGASPRPVGVKVSGRITTVQTAESYYEQVQKALKVDKLTEKQFRIGASQLLDEILKDG